MHTNNIIYLHKPANSYRAECEAIKAEIEATDNPQKYIEAELAAEGIKDARVVGMAKARFLNMLDRELPIEKAKQRTIAIARGEAA